MVPSMAQEPSAVAGGGETVVKTLTQAEYDLRIRRMGELTAAKAAWDLLDKQLKVKYGDSRWDNSVSSVNGVKTTTIVTIDERVVLIKTIKQVVQ